MKEKLKFQVSLVCIFLLAITNNYLFSTNYETKATANDTLNMFALTGFATVDYEITGGKGGDTVTASDYSQLTNYTSANNPYIIKIEGTITGSGMLGVAAETMRTTHSLDWLMIEEKENFRDLAVMNVVRGYSELVTGATTNSDEERLNKASVRPSDLPEDFRELEIGSNEWRLYWKLHKDKQDEMLAWKEEKGE